MEGKWLDIDCKVLGLKHPNTATVREGLLSLYLAQGREAEAKTLEQEAQTGQTVKGTLVVKGEEESPPPPLPNKDRTSPLEGEGQITQ